MRRLAGLGAGAGSARRVRVRGARPPVVVRSGAVRGVRRGSPAELADLLRAVTAVAAAVRSGAAPAEAWHRVGIAARLGVPVADDLARRWRGQPRARAALVAAAELSATLGVAPAGVLDQVAVALVRDAEAESARRAALAGPLATARLLTALPVVGVLLGLALGADPLAVLLDGGAGTALALAGGLLLLAGHRWTARYVAAARRAAA